MVPMSSKADAVTALSLYPACKWRGRVAQRLAWAGISVFGPHVLPGARSEWRPPCGDEVWELLASAWRRTTGPFNSFGVHLRRPLGRDGFSVLLIESGEPRAFVKIRRSPSEGLRRELSALEALRRRSNPAFLAPVPLDEGSADGWEYLMLSPLPPHVHSVVRSSDSLRSVVEEIQSLGQSWGELGKRTPGWAPMHGDLTPWNLRLIGEQVFLYDWESTGWGPSGADLLWYDVAIASHGLRMPMSGAEHSLKSYDFWLEEVETSMRSGDAPDPQVVENLRRGVSRLRPGTATSA
jgi:hypothetical protein